MSNSITAVIKAAARYYNTLCDIGFLALKNVYVLSLFSSTAGKIWPISTPPQMMWIPQKDYLLPGARHPHWTGDVPDPHSASPSEVSFPPGVSWPAKLCIGLGARIWGDPPDRTFRELWHGGHHVHRVIEDIDLPPSACQFGDCAWLSIFFNAPLHCSACVLYLS